MRRPWSDAEKTAVKKHLGNFLAQRRVPGKNDCLRAIQAEKALCQRSWKNVKKNYVSQQHCEFKSQICYKEIVLNERDAGSGFGASVFLNFFWSLFLTWF